MVHRPGEQVGLFFDGGAGGLLEPGGAVFGDGQERDGRADGGGFVENFDLHERRHEFFRRSVEDGGRGAIEIVDGVVFAEIDAHAGARAIARALPDLGGKIGHSALKHGVEDDGVEDEIAIFEAGDGDLQSVFADDFEVLRIGSANVLHGGESFGFGSAHEKPGAIEDASGFAESVGGELMDVEGGGNVLAENCSGDEDVVDLARLALGDAARIAGDFAIGADQDLVWRADDDDAGLRRGGWREKTRYREHKNQPREQRRLPALLHVCMMPQNRGGKFRCVSALQGNLRIAPNEGSGRKTDLVSWPGRRDATNPGSADRCGVGRKWDRL